MQKLAHILWISILMTGCDWIERQVADPQPSIADGGHLVFPNPMEEVNQTVDLVTVLDPKRHAEKQFIKQRGGADAWKKLTEGQKIDLAFLAFYDRGVYSDDPRLRRNKIQERLLAASHHRCNIFKSLLYQIRSKTNFVLGALSTVTGIAGSIVTGVDGSRILSGTSGILGGVRAELNQELFQNLATQVIVQGIDTRRREIYQEIVDLGQTKSISDYPVEAAVKDSVIFHGQCSIIVGFEVARDSIQTLEDPGIAVANRILAKLVTTRKLLDVEEITPEEAERALMQSRGDLPLAGTSLSTLFGAASPLQSMQNASESIRINTAAFRSAIEGSDLEEGVRTDILKTLGDAEANAREGLASCNTMAIEASTKLLEASQQAVLSVPTQEDAALEAAALEAEIQLEKARSEGRGVSRRINQIPELMSERIEKAFKALDKARRILKVKKTVDQNDINEITSPLTSFPAFKSCAPPAGTSQSNAEPNENEAEAEEGAAPNADNNN